MSFSNSQAPQVNLARHKYDRPLFVDMEAFFTFSFWIAEELLDLEATYKENGSPTAGLQQPHRLGIVRKLQPNSSRLGDSVG